mgnify:CR=1 FL=1
MFLIMDAILEGAQKQCSDRITDGEELKNSSMISVSLESSAVQERLEAAIYQALCLHLITSPHHSALYSYCAYVVLKSYSKRTHKARS